MFKFLFKLALVIIAIYILLQIPFISKYVEQFRADVNQKVENVTEEVDRLKGKYNETKEKVTEFKDKVAETKEGIEKTVKEVGEMVETVDKLINGDEEKKAVRGSEEPSGFQREEMEVEKEDGGETE